MIPIITFEGELGHPFIGGFNRPKIQWLDWDIDGDLDLFILDVGGYLRYIQNQGTDSNPEFHLITPSFQELYLGSWFYFSDFDFDGDLDLMSQNENNADHISLFTNDGGEIIFFAELISVNGEGVNSPSVMTPTFADIDIDGDLDFFVGNMVGTLTFYENTGLLDGIPQFQHITNFWQDISIIGSQRLDDDHHGASALKFIDLDADGDLDLSWGDYFQQSLYIIWNLGTAEEADMNEVNITTEYPPNNPLETAGQNMPSFADLDGDDDPDLYVTVLSGAYGNQSMNNFYYYENTGSAIAPEFIFQTDSYFSCIDRFANTAPELADLDNDGDLDLLIANQYDISVVPFTGRIYFFRNIGSDSSPVFQEEETNLLDESIGQMLTVETGDLDGDGMKDLVIGDFNGFIKIYKNISTDEFLLFEFVEEVMGIDLSGNSVPALLDIDNDFDLDLFIGQLNGEIVFYRNTGSQFQFVFQQDEMILPLPELVNSAPEFFDITGDGVQELMIGTESSGILLYINQSGYNEINFEPAQDYDFPILGLNIKLAAARWGNSESKSFFAGTALGGLYHFMTFASGDINFDTLLDIQDVICSNNIILGLINPNADEFYSADLNFDDEVNVQDTLLLISLILN